jgi:hypothetical protein
MSRFGGRAILPIHASDPTGAEGMAIFDSRGNVLKYHDGSRWYTVVESAVLSGNGKGYVNHGSTAGTARPSGFASVEWYGSVEPSNMANGDTWIDTS